MRPQACATHPPFLTQTCLFQACATPRHLLVHHWGEPFGEHFNLHLWFTFSSNGSPQWGDCPTNGEEWHTPGLFSRIYASQTKMLENGTTCRACCFEVLCEGSSPKLSTHTLAKYLETHARRAVPFSNIFVWEA